MAGSAPPIPPHGTSVSTVVRGAVDVVVLPVRVAAGLVRVFEHIESLALGITAIHEEILGMRRDIRSLDDHVMDLTDEVHSMTGGVDGIRSATERLEAKVGDLGGSLEGVNALVTR